MQSRARRLGRVLVGAAVRLLICGRVGVGRDWEASRFSILEGVEAAEVDGSMVRFQ